MKSIAQQKPAFFKKPQQEPEQKNTDSKGDKKSFKKPFKFKSKGCFRCGGNHDHDATDNSIFLGTLASEKNLVPET